MRELFASEASSREERFCERSEKSLGILREAGNLGGNCEHNNQYWGGFTREASNCREGRVNAEGNLTTQ